MEYQSLYRKYRPQNFDEVEGQEIVLKILKNALQNNRVSHAYLFAGPRGTGKTSIAKILAKAINCELPKNGNSCDNCPSCNAANSKESIDILEIDAASNNGVDEIRELRNKINLVPGALQYKVYIIDEVHMLTTGAFNALLKTLEEPPKHAIFILATTELHKVPSTILSRCQTLEFKKINNESLIKKLSEICKKEKISIAEEALKEITKYADGGMRDAIGMIEKLSLYTNEEITAEDVRKINGNISRQQAIELVELILDKKKKEIIQKINEYNDSGIDLIKLADEIIMYLRDTIFDQNPSNTKDLILLIEELSFSKTKMIISTTPKIILEMTIMSYCTENSEKTIENKQIIADEERKTETNVRIDGEDKHKATQNIRVNNMFTAVDKNLIKEAREKWEKLRDEGFNVEYGSYARILYDDAVPVAASTEYLAVTFKIDALAKQCADSIEKVEELIEKILNKKYRLIFLTNEEWKTHTEEYKKNKNQYKYIEETPKSKKIEKEEKPNATLKDKAKELFGEI